MKKSMEKAVDAIVVALAALIAGALVIGSMYSLAFLLSVITAA